MINDVMQPEVIVLLLQTKTKLIQMVKVKMLRLICWDIEVGVSLIMLILIMSKKDKLIPNFGWNLMVPLMSTIFILNLLMATRMFRATRPLLLIRHPTPTQVPYKTFFQVCKVTKHNFPYLKLC